MNTTMAIMMAKTTTAVALEATTAGEGPACVGRGKFVNYFGLLIALPSTLYPLIIKSPEMTEVTPLIRTLMTGPTQGVWLD